MKYSALIPVKRLDLAKSRLAAHLSQDRRESLVLDMLQHVVSTLCDSEIFEQVYVVSADAHVLALVQHWGAEPLREAQQGHNPALQAATQIILERAAWRHGMYTWTTAGALDLLKQGREAKQAFPWLENLGLLTISADLPLLTQVDIRALVRQAERSAVVLAASGDGTGTNAILMRPPMILPYLFGPNSLPAYIQAAQQRQVSYALLQNAHLALDIDTPDDLRQLERHHTHAWSSMASFAM